MSTDCTGHTGGPPGLQGPPEAFRGVPLSVPPEPSRPGMRLYAALPVWPSSTSCRGQLQRQQAG